MVYTFDLKNKVVLLTGGYGYLGKAIAESLLLHNAKVIVLGRDINKFEEVFSEIKSSNLSNDLPSIERILNQHVRQFMYKKVA